MQRAKLSVPCGANSLVLLASVTGKRLQKAAIKPSKSTPLLWSKPCNLIYAFVLCAWVCVCVKKAVQGIHLYFTCAIPQKFPDLCKSMYFLLHENNHRLYSHTVKQITPLPVSDIYSKAELELSLKLLCYETADNTQLTGGGPSVSVLLQSILVMTKRGTTVTLVSTAWTVWCALSIPSVLQGGYPDPRCLLSPKWQVGREKEN